MKTLEEKILTEGKVLSGNVLKVGSFLNHQIDVPFLMEMGKEIARLYENTKITKILTVESSGIAIAVAAAAFINVPVVFAKKAKTKNVEDNVYSAKVESFTHGKVFDIVVCKDYISAGDNVLIIDDFLALGNAINGLRKIIDKSGANCCGVAVAIEKGFQHGGDELRSGGLRVESLAIIDSMESGNIVYRK